MSSRYQLMYICGQPWPLWPNWAGVPRGEGSQRMLCRGTPGIREAKGRGYTSGGAQCTHDRPPRPRSPRLATPHHLGPSFQKKQGAHPTDTGTATSAYAPPAGKGLELGVGRTEVRVLVASQARAPRPTPLDDSVHATCTHGTLL